jgi:hypothetical protein
MSHRHLLRLVLLLVGVSVFINLKKRIDGTVA